jgi:predicted phage terminase large subunit-like protein
MAPSPGKMYADVLRNDLYAFIHRSFLELNGGSRFEPNWHLEILTAKLSEVAAGTCRRLIINIPPRHLKSHSASIAFPAWLLGQDPTKQVLAVSYAQDLSEKLARDCRALMASPFYQSVFKTRLSPDRQAVSDFETTDGGYRFSTSVGGVLTGRGADIIILDDPLKADDALSEARRVSLNEWYDNTLRSRLNSQEKGAIVIVMQRLHADDLVAHVTEHETWDVVSFPAIAERTEIYEVHTPYGRRNIRRNAGEILQSALVSTSTLESLRRNMTEYNFAAQYQQDPQPPAGLIVRREWLRFYTPVERPARFDQILQSWDTANKATELSNYSVCTTWGVDDQRLYLLDVFRRKMEFPELKKTVQELATLHRADVVLVEDKASGTQLIQELRADNISIVEAAPALDGDKIMRLRSQTAKIEGGFVLFPKDERWLDAYLLELTTFPNSKNDDQVDSTVNALAWMTEQATKPGMGILNYYKQEAEKLKGPSKTKMMRVTVPGESSHWILITGRNVSIPEDRIIEVTEEESIAVLRAGGRRVD